MTRTRTRMLVAVVAASLLATACGGGDDDDSGDDPVIVVDGGAGESAASASGTTADADTADTGGDAATSDEDAARAFAQCMRDNGVEDFPDPTVSADGSVDFGFGRGGGPGGDDGAPPEDGAGAGGDDDVEQATEACGDLLAGTSLLPSEEDLTEMEDSLLEAAQCLRDQGIDVDDPDLGAIGQGDGGAGAGGGPFGDAFDPDDPEVQAAIEACQDVFTAIAPGDD